jgi:transcription antitermination factor NusG
MKTKINEPDLRWYAVYTRPRWEKKVANTLAKKGIEHYCPLNKVVRQWSDRKKIVLEPLFTSYVFVRITSAQVSEVFDVKGILNFVYWLNKRAVIRDKEIESVKHFLNDHENVRLLKTDIKIDDTVRVTHGPLMDFEGNVVCIKNHSVKVQLPSLGYIMYAEVEKTNVVIIPKQKVDGVLRHLKIEDPRIVDAN